MPRLRAFALATALASALAAGCVPRPGGQCAADADCGYGLTCQEGLCRTPAPLACATACGAGLHCADGYCALDVAPEVAWRSPADGAFAAAGMVALELSVKTAAADVSVVVVAEPAAPGAAAAPRRLALQADGGDGLFRGLLDASALEERAWSLRPAVQAAHASWSGPPLALRVDRSGPTLELLVPAPPVGGSFLRTDTVEVRARASDAGAGLDPASLALVAEGMEPLAGTRLSATDWSFQLPLSAPAFRAAEGPLAFSLRGRDLLGNPASAAAAVPVTRRLWSRDVGGGLPVRSSPALDAGRVFVGTDAARVVALERTRGVVLWSRAMAGPVSASPARGARLLYAASEGGEVRALDPDSGAVAWSCPDLPGPLGFLSSPAVLPVPDAAPGGGALEAIALQNSGTFALAGAEVRGGLFALEGSAGFPVSGGARSCWVLASVSGGRGSPAAGPDGALYAGGDDGRAHKLRLLPDGAGAFSFREEWSLPAQDDLGASPAVAGGAIAFADDSGRLLRVGENGAALAAGEAVGEKLLASPVIAFGTTLLLGRDGALAAFGSQPAAFAPPAFGPQTVGGASGIAATPAVGADGTLYVAAGRSLRALSPSGQAIWELALGGAATASSPAIGCDGTLYVGDASGALTAVATDSKGLAPGWPRFRHDARGTGNAATAGCE